ncbi:MAG: carbon-nitrogen hydrolase family protein [Bryobacteraceae bacterium]
MQRRSFLAGVGVSAVAGPMKAAPEREDGTIRSRAAAPPRKVIVGTVMQDLWGKNPGLQPRLDQLTGLVDRLAADARKKYGRGPDIAALPETAITGEAKDALAAAVPLAGPVQEAFARKAREHRCYIVAPTYLREPEGKQVSNAAILFARDGSVAGIYRKVHLVVGADGESTEGGSSLGKEVPVFDCDFGKVGMQICYDMEFDTGWKELARQGCELVIWPTQSPQTATPAFRAMRQGYYIVSSTWRSNATIFEPTGRIAAQIRPPEGILTYELDLSYAILPWTGPLDNGRAMRKKFGDKVGFHYYEEEDRGIFWSNDPNMSIGQMIRSMGLEEQQEQLARVRKVYRRAGLRDL